MVIPKYPDVPTLTKKQIDQITEITFLKEITPQNVMQYSFSAVHTWQLASSSRSLSTRFRK